MKKKFKELKPIFDIWLEEENGETTLHPIEIAYVLKHINKRYGIDEFFRAIDRINNSLLGEIILELPEKLKSEAIDHLSPKELSEATNQLESDDATDLIQEIEEKDDEKAQKVLSFLDIGDKAEINRLRQYEENQAGAWMQTEFFYAFQMESVGDAIERLREMKRSGEIQEVYQLFIVTGQFEFLGSMRIDDLAIRGRDEIFLDILAEFSESGHSHFKSVFALDNIKVVSQMFEEYNLQVLPVIDDKNRIIGRITSDDAFDMIEDIATEQVYSMAGVNDEVEEDSRLHEVIKTRAYWLGLNLLTAILASLVIGIFDTTLQALIPLAILMPIVASMGGNAGTQTLTVVVRQIALGEIEFGDGREIIKKEVIISLVNGFLFALVISVVTYFWFDQYMLGVVIGVAMVVNLFVAGFFGSMIPLTLKRFHIDPAIGSTVLLTTATDIFGFFVFLGLAQTILL
jgi:magnesium transporter